MPGELGQAQSQRACAYRARRGRFELSAAGEVRTRQRGSALGQARAGAVVHDFAAALAAFRAEVNDVIGPADDAGLVLNDDQSVAEVAQVF